MLVRRIFGYWWRTEPGHWIPLEGLKDTHLLHIIQNLERRYKLHPDEWFVLLWIVRLETEADRRALPNVNATFQRRPYADKDRMVR